LRGSQHNAKRACSKNVHNFMRRQRLEEAGSRKTLIRSTCITPRQVAAWTRLNGSILRSRAVFSNRPEGTDPTSADWSFVTGSKEVEPPARSTSAILGGLEQCTADSCDLCHKSCSPQLIPSTRSVSPVPWPRAGASPFATAAAPTIATRIAFERVTFDALLMPSPRCSQGVETLFDRRSFTRPSI
jgi:hypothetical protein